MTNRTPTPRQLFYYHSEQLERWERLFEFAESRDEEDKVQRQIVFHDNMCRKYLQMAEASSTESFKSK